jgi:hypothetical protein
MTDNKYPAYYTDTDSIHLNKQDYTPLCSKYKELYGRELDGPNLGQLSDDFDAVADGSKLGLNKEDAEIFEKAVKHKYNPEAVREALSFEADIKRVSYICENYRLTTGDTVAKSSIFLGKKAYVDMVQQTAQTPNGVKSYVTPHVRLKGCTKAGLAHKANELSKTRDDKYLNLFRKLAKGEKMQITLNPYDAKNNRFAVMFAFNARGVALKTTFKREINF